MLFNSAHFLLFFPVVTLGCFTLPQRFRWLWLLLASCYFYMALIPVYILILFFTIGVDYVSGILIEGAQGRRRKWLLGLSIATNLGVLAFFKYFNFFNDTLASLYQGLGWAYSVQPLSMILPVGLSFHTFQSLSYTIEVYRGHQNAERHPGIFALYVMFYPQLVAGPIERPQHLLHQFRETHRFDYQRVTDGLKLMVWGLFKKVVIADRLALVVNPVYAQPQDHTSLTLLLATVAFAYQIYCDFSGYSDMAIGAARVMGFQLMRNFDRPYAAASVGEFWKRWHISLSTWFRDYLYIPLGGNRVPAWRWQINLFLVFLVSGLWHGANWTFVIWGALHGFYLVSSLWTRGLREQIAAAIGLTRLPRVRRAWQTLATFALVCFAWVFFRAANLGDAFHIVRQLFGGWARVADATRVDWSLALPALAGILVLEAVQMLQRRGDVLTRLNQLPAWQRWVAYYAVVLFIVACGQFGESQFIYFQF